MVELLEQKDMEKFKKVCTELPAQLQNRIYHKHWEEMGRPTEQSKEAALRKIAHPDFGRASFLGLDKRCDVLPERKAATLGALIADVRQIRQSIVQIRDLWEKIDTDQSFSGSEKNIQKKNSLSALARGIIPFFTTDEVKSPNLLQDSFKGYAAAYAERYACLQPFFLQLIPDLIITPRCASQDIEGQKKYLIEIMDQTFATLVKRGYRNAKDEWVSLNLDTAKASIAVVKSSEKKLRQRPFKYKTQIHLDNRNSLDVAEDLANRGLNPIVLDAASDEHFGGGYKTGTRAREEAICRRSGLSVVAQREQEFYGLSKKWGPSAGLYIKDVPVFRDQEYAYKDQPFSCAFAIFAPLNNPSLTDGKLTGKENNETIEKIRTILHMAELKGHDSIVLVPFGCGAFNNPARDISLIMMVVIEKEFPNSFKEIRFAVPEDPNSQNVDSAYIVFKGAIECYRNSLLETKYGAKIFIN